MYFWLFKSKIAEKICIYLKIFSCRNDTAVLSDSSKIFQSFFFIYSRFPSESPSDIAHQIFSGFILNFQDFLFFRKYFWGFSRYLYWDSSKVYSRNSFSTEIIQRVPSKVLKSFFLIFYLEFLLQVYTNALWDSSYYSLRNPK